MNIHLDLKENGYDIVVERGILSKAGEHLNLNRRVLVVTDSGVPPVYAETVAEQCTNPVICTVEQGEASKSLETFGRLLSTMLENGFSRKDCVVAVGGGVVGDLAGFVASAYMRGVDFYNIPTTLLSQIDSSIGGKTAINFGGIKNIVGAFYQPKKVLIDPELLITLPGRQISNGLAEAVKMSLTSDPELFEIFEKGDIQNNLDLIIEKSLRIKKSVVEADEKESGIRKILNFGHTLAHAFEAQSELKDIYHGEAVALGMLPMCSDGVKNRLLPVLQKLNLPTDFDMDIDVILSAVAHDKKADGNDITVIFVPQIGEYEMKKISIEEFKRGVIK